MAQLRLPATQPPFLPGCTGKNGGWIGGGLSWAKLDSLHYYGAYPAAHVRWLQEMYALYRSRSDRSAYYSYGYSYGEEKSIDLSAFESRQLWPMLDEAESIGLRLVYGRKLGVVQKYRSAELCLDVTGGGPSGSLVITPLIRVDGMHHDAAPVRFIGAAGHGLVYVDPAEARRASDHGGWRFRLAKLAKAVPPQLQRMALENERLEVPAAEQPRFRDGYYPRLRHAATVISSDGSFTPPAISDPTLVLQARPMAPATTSTSAGIGPTRLAIRGYAHRCIRARRRPDTGIWTPSRRSWPTSASRSIASGCSASDPVSADPQQASRPAHPARRH